MQKFKRWPDERIDSNKKNKVILFILVGFTVLIGFLVYTFWDLPSVDALPANLQTPSIRITDRNGRLLYDILPEQGGRHAVLSFNNIPQCMKDAAIAVEDKNFYSNLGIDFGGIIRALWMDIRGGETIAGGSTITQQVARNLLLSQNERYERTLRRKLREAVLAWELTQKLSKNDMAAWHMAWKPRRKLILVNLPVIYFCLNARCLPVCRRRLDSMIRLRILIWQNSANKLYWD